MKILKILKAFWSFAVTYLMVSAIIIPIILADPSYETCDDCRPTKVIYCSMPLEIPFSIDQNKNYMLEEGWTIPWESSESKRYVVPIDAVEEEALILIEHTFGNFQLWVNDLSGSGTLLQDRETNVFSHSSGYLYITPLITIPDKKCCCDNAGCAVDTTSCCWAYSCPSSHQYSCPDAKCTGMLDCPEMGDIFIKVIVRYSPDYETPPSIPPDEEPATNPIEIDHQYFFFIDKNSDWDLDLLIKDVSPMQQYNLFEPLLPNTASGDTDMKTVHAYHSTSFILHGDGNELKIKDDNFIEPINIIPIEDAGLECDELVAKMMYSQLKIVDDYAEGEYGITGEQINFQSRLFSSIYNEALRPDLNNPGIFEVGDNIQVFRAKKIHGDLNFESVGSYDSFGDAINVLRAPWPTDVESLAYFASEIGTDKTVMLLDLNDIVVKEVSGVYHPSPGDMEGILLWLFENGLIFNGDYLHTHPGGEFILTRADVINYGEIIQQMKASKPYPYTYGKMTILDPDNGDFRIYLLDLDQVEVTTILYHAYEKSLIDLGLPDAEINTRLKAYIGKAASPTVYKYELVIGDNPAGGTTNSILKIMRIDKQLEHLGELELEIAGFNRKHWELYKSVQEEWGETGLIPADKWTEIVETVTEAKGLAELVKSRLDFTEGTTDSSLVKVKVSHLRSTCDDLISRWNYIASKGSGSPADIALPTDVADNIQRNFLYFKNDLIKHLEALKKQLPELIDELEAHGIIVGDRPTLSQSVEEGIDNLRKTADDVIILYDQDTIVKSRKALNEAGNSKWIGRLITITATIGDVLVAAGIVLQSYGEYVDNVDIILAAKNVWLVGVGIQILSVGISIAGLLAAVIGGTAISLSAIFIGAVTGTVLGIVVSFVALVIFNLIVCWLHPESPWCGCSVHPYYENPVLSLETTSVAKGDILKSTTYGMQYCHPFYFMSVRVITGAYLHNDNHPDYDPVGDYKKSCDLEDGTCCEGSVNVNLEEGEYDVFANVWQDWGDHSEFIGKTNKIHLTVVGCNPDKTGDDGVCHEGCCADEECRFIDPSANLLSCNKAGYSYFQDTCSDCSAGDKDNVCRSPGSLSWSCKGFNTESCDYDTQSTCNADPFCHWDICYGSTENICCPKPCNHVDFSEDKVLCSSCSGCSVVTVDGCTADPECDGVQADTSYCDANCQYVPPCSFLSGDDCTDRSDCCWSSFWEVCKSEGEECCNAEACTQHKIDPGCGDGDCCYHCPNDALNCYECDPTNPAADPEGWMHRCEEGTISYDPECEGKFIDPDYGDNTCDGGTCDSSCDCTLTTSTTTSISTSTSTLTSITTTTSGTTTVHFPCPANCDYCWKSCHREDPDDNFCGDGDCDCWYNSCKDGVCPCAGCDTRFTCCLEGDLCDCDEECPSGVSCISGVCGGGSVTTSTIATTTSSTTTTAPDCGMCQLDECEPVCSGDCPFGKGDCDNYLECQSGLICGSNIGSDFGCGSSIDICVECTSDSDCSGSKICCLQHEINGGDCLSSDKYKCFIPPSTTTTTSTSTSTSTSTTIPPEICDETIEGTLAETYTISDSNKRYCLTNDVSIDGQTAIKFAPGVHDSTLDCQGHQIDGAESITPETWGVQLGTGANGNIIKDCFISNFENGIRLESGTSENNIIDNIFVFNDKGINLFDSEYNNIKYNQLQSLPTKNQYGISLYQNSDYNNLINNTIMNLGETGIGLSSSNHNTLTNNTLQTTHRGIILGSSNYNTLTDNIIKSSDAGGIILTHSSDNNINGGLVALSDPEYYLLSGVDSTYFKNTDFTDYRDIYFHSTTSWFNYNDKESIDLWLKTRVDPAATITRKVTSWSKSLLAWNENPPSPVEIYYEISGLYKNAEYKFSIDETEVNTMETNDEGVLSSFKIGPISGEHEMKLKYVRPPSGGCPTLFVYDGKEYKEERISNLHSEEGVDTVDEIALTVEPVVEDGYYRLMLREMFFPGHSHVDSVKLFVDGKETKLISAMHSKYGDVTSILKETDDIRTDTKLWDEIELKFTATSKAESFVFKIEGYNPSEEGSLLEVLTGMLVGGPPRKTPIGITPGELIRRILSVLGILR